MNDFLLEAKDFREALRGFGEHIKILLPQPPKRHSNQPIKINRLDLPLNSVKGHERIERFIVLKT